MSTPQELTQIAHDNWNANRGVDPEVLRDLGYDTPETLPATVERVLGEEATQRTASLELVTEEHTPQAGARREARLRERPAARTAKDKAARDIGEARQRQGVVPQGHDPYIHGVQ